MERERLDMEGGSAEEGGDRQCTTDPYSLQVTGISNFSPFALSSGGSGLVGRYN